MNTIATILPKGEGFSDDSFGAISLCIRDFTLHSRYKDTTHILGGVDLPGFEGINYHFMPVAKWYQNRSKSYIAHCMNFIRKQNIDLVEIHNRPHFVHHMKNRITSPITLHLHNDPQEMKYTRTPKERSIMVESCAGIYCVSSYIKQRFMEGVPEHFSHKVHVVHNGIELTENRVEKEHIILFAGRMTEGKGALLLAEALKVCLPDFPAWKAVFVGSRRHQSGMKLTPHEEAIYATLAPLGNQAEMAGFLSHPETMYYFARSAIAVIPSIWNEPFGRTAIEAMSKNCAIISSHKGGLPEILLDNAIMLEALTPKCLASHLRELMQDEAKRNELQRKAGIRAKAFDIVQMTKRLDNLRKNILRPIIK